MDLWKPLGRETRRDLKCCLKLIHSLSEIMRVKSPLYARYVMEMQS